MPFPKALASSSRPASRESAETVSAAEKLAHFHRVSWKQALGKIVSPAFRLHRYRSVHNQLLQDALRELDRPAGGERN